MLAATGPRDTHLRHDRPPRASLNQQTHRLVITAERARRERLGEIDLPHEILPVLRQGCTLYAERLAGRANSAGGAHNERQADRRNSNDTPKDPHHAALPISR